jgi:hypothetical protein
MPEEVLSDGFAISARPVGTHAVLVEILGELDVQTAPQARAFLAQVTAATPRHLILDLTGVRFLMAASRAPARKRPGHSASAAAPTSHNAPPRAASVTAMRPSQIAAASSQSVLRRRFSCDLRARPGTQPGPEAAAAACRVAASDASARPCVHASRALPPDSGHGVVD